MKFNKIDFGPRVDGLIDASAEAAKATVRTMTVAAAMWIRISTIKLQQLAKEANESLPKMLKELDNEDDEEFMFIVLGKDSKPKKKGKKSVIKLYDSGPEEEAQEAKAE